MGQSGRARRVCPKHWAMQGEYYDGEDLGVDVMGWYGQVEYAFGACPVPAFSRRDTDDSGGADDFARDTVWLAWFRTKTDQVTVQGESDDDGRGCSFVNWSLQYRVSY